MIVIAPPEPHPAHVRKRRAAASPVVPPGEGDGCGLRAAMLTVEQYHRMIESGILAEGEPVELIGGVLVRKNRSKAGEDEMTVGLEHVYSVQALSDLGPKLRKHGCYIRVQQPITIPDHDEPEPDAAIVRGTKEDYRSRQPGPADVTCVIEVADSSLRVDRTVKLAVYADAGIPQYVIVNLRDRQIEVYTESVAGTGHYARATTLRVGRRVELLTSRSPKAGAKGRLAVPVKGFLP